MESLADAQKQLVERKQVMRRQAYDARNAQQEKNRTSERIIARFLDLPEYQQTRTAMWYIDCRSEVRTKVALAAAIASDKQIAVPYCTVDEQGANKLGLWTLEDMDELVVGTWNILEPPRDRWGEPAKEIDPKTLDIVMTPGVGFSRDGGRMGNGQGYYDRLLERVRPDCALVAICFESQLFDELVVGPHDVFMDKVVTEAAVYEGRGRK